MVFAIASYVTMFFSIWRRVNDSLGSTGAGRHGLSGRSRSHTWSWASATSPVRSGLEIRAPGALRTRGQRLAGRHVRSLTKRQLLDEQRGDEGKCDHRQSNEE